MSNTQYIDKEEALGRIRGNTKLYAKMLKMFLASEDFEKITTSFEAGDINAAEAAVHSVKGTSGNLSLKVLFAVCVRFMDELRAGQMNKATFGEFQKELATTVTHINELLPTLEQ
jgi:HPt (histidine-containing phosphotransfer) domain-containing protein